MKVSTDMNDPAEMKAIKKILVISTGFVICAGLSSALLGLPENSNDRIDPLVFFGLSHEDNFPTWYACSLLSLCGAALALISIFKWQDKDPFIWHWIGLSVVFFYISFDEYFEIHEDASLWFDYGGFLSFGWVIPGTVFVILYIKFLMYLSSIVRRQFIIAGAVFVGGALGVGDDFGLLGRERRRR